MSVEKRLEELEDEEVTRLYNEAYADAKAVEENRALAEEMLRLAPKGDETDNLPGNKVTLRKPSPPSRRDARG